MASARACSASSTRSSTPRRPPSRMYDASRVGMHRLMRSRPQRMRQEMNEFLQLFLRFLETSGTTIDWSKIRPPPQDLIIKYESLTEPTNAATIRQLLDKLVRFLHRADTPPKATHCSRTRQVVLKLNGGLGTTMGCKGPKSAIEVRDGLTFLDMTVMQIEVCDCCALGVLARSLMLDQALNKTFGCNVPLVLMNSFNTEKETQQIIQKYEGRSVQVRRFRTPDTRTHTRALDLDPSPPICLVLSMIASQRNVAMTAKRR
jgi:UDP-N-acetylglucosamine pyrophosphorylase